jgi:nitrogen fixation protein
MEFLPVLELIDRLCIARVKHARTQGANQVELDWYEQRFRQLPQSAELDEAVQAMTDIHHAIWDLEWQLKSGVEQMLSLQEIGRRAIAIRDFNNRRIAFKNTVARILNHPVLEIKQDHLADGTVVIK